MFKFCVRHLFLIILISVPKLSFAQTGIFLPEDKNVKQYSRSIETIVTKKQIESPSIIRKILPSVIRQQKGSIAIFETTKINSKLKPITFAIQRQIPSVAKQQGTLFEDQIHTKIIERNFLLHRRIINSMKRNLLIKRTPLSQERASIRRKNISIMKFWKGNNDLSFDSYIQNTRETVI